MAEKRIDWGKIALFSGVIAALGYFLTRKPPVVALPEITGNTISAPKTDLAVGETVTVTGTLTFKDVLPRDSEAKIDVYTDTSKTKTFMETFTGGASSGTYHFTISFTNPGTYTVYTDANWG